MAVKQLLANNLFANPSIREAAKGFIISLKASSRYAPPSVDTLEFALGLFATYAEDQDWPGANFITTSHVEDYLTYLQTRPRWFGREKVPQLVSKTHVEGQYRRPKTFFNWCVKRGHRETNPLDLIPHPKIDEKTVPTISEFEFHDLLRTLDMQPARTNGQRFRRVRDRAVLLMFWDTPARRNELANIKFRDVDLDGSGVLVMGKGRQERWMPIGGTVLESFWEYMQSREALKPRADNFWVDSDGKPMKPVWVHFMLKRLGVAAGVSVHAHQFRHTWAMNMLPGGMPEEMIRRIAGWRKIPDTYFRTLAAEDMARTYKQMSPADKLWGSRQEPKRRQRQGQRKPRGKL